MRMLAERAAVLSLLTVSACSDRSAPREDPGHAPAALGRASVSVLWPSEAGWRVPGAGDFNRDGMQDMLWRDHDGNRVAAALMGGTRVLEQAPMMPGPPGNDWMIVGAGADFNGDGMADMHWYNPTTKRAVVWLMAGTEPFVRGPEIPGPGEGW